MALGLLLYPWHNIPQVPLPVVSLSTFIKDENDKSENLDFFKIIKLKKPFIIKHDQGKCNTVSIQSTTV